MPNIKVNIRHLRLSPKPYANNQDNNMQQAISLYQYYAGKRGLQALVLVDDITSGSDCGRLNLMCPVCFDRVHLVERCKRLQRERYFAHYPNSENRGCENKLFSISPHQTEKRIIQAINKEKADYERYFWLIITQVFNVVSRTEELQKVILAHAKSNWCFDTVFYPVFKECKSLIQTICMSVLDGSVDKNWDNYDGLSRHDKKLVERVLRQNSKIYRNKACLLLSEFLLQKKSYFIVKKLWAVSIALYKLEFGFDAVIPAPSKFIPDVLNNIMSFLIWVPWDAVLHDIKVSGEVQKRNRYSETFDLITISNLPEMPNEINQLYSQTRNFSKLRTTGGFDWS